MISSCPASCQDVATCWCSNNAARCIPDWLKIVSTLSGSYESRGSADKISMVFRWYIWRLAVSRALAYCPATRVSTLNTIDFSIRTEPLMMYFAAKSKYALTAPRDLNTLASDSVWSVGDFGSNTAAISTIISCKSGKGIVGSGFIDPPSTQPSTDSEADLDRPSRAFEFAESRAIDNVRNIPLGSTSNSTRMYGNSNDRWPTSGIRLTAFFTCVEGENFSCIKNRKSSSFNEWARLSGSNRVSCGNVLPAKHACKYKSAL